MKATLGTYEAMSELLIAFLNGEGRGFMSIHFTQYNKDWSPVAKEVAQNKANQIAAVFGVEPEECEVRENGVGDFVVRNQEGKIRIVFSFVEEEI